MKAPLIQLNNIAFGYYDCPVFSGVNLSLFSGDRLALLGGNGAGKTSLMQLIVGLQSPTEGQISAFGKVRHVERDFMEVRTRIGLLFQDSDDQLFCPSVIEDVAFGPLNLGLSKQEATVRAKETLAKLGLEHLSDRITHKLSGGQKRLVALATVLAMQPDVLLLDEPTNGLDENAERRLVELLESLDLAMVIVSHDRTLIERLANRAVLLKNGTLEEAVMHKHPHQHNHSHLHIHPKGQKGHLEHKPPIEVHEEHSV